MTSLTDLYEVVDVVIGVDTHVHAHCAAAVDTATGGVLDEITVEATAEGYAELVEFANNHATLRAWAIEGTGGHGAGLSRHLLDLGEIVVELDRPSGLRGATARSPTRSMRSGRRVRRWRGPGSVPHAAVGNARRCRCCWRPAVLQSPPLPRRNTSVQPGHRRAR